MTAQTMRRRAVAGLAASLVALGGIALGAATPLGANAPAFAHDGDHGDETGSACTVDSSTLQWGVKTSFRNYISGSIANGEWLTENGASYETPAFQWADGEGEIADDLSTGSIAFTGDVFFSGHDGLMQLNVSNPEIVFDGQDSAQLVLDIGSDDSGDGDVVQESVVAAKVDLAGYDTGDGHEFALQDAAVRLTAEGASALNGAFGDYVSGEEMDPLTLTMSVSGCDLGGGATPEAPAEETEQPTDTEESEVGPVEDSGTEVPWLPIIIGGVALIVVGVTTGMLIAGRKKPARTDTDA